MSNCELLIYKMIRQNCWLAFATMYHRDKCFCIRYHVREKMEKRNDMHRFANLANSTNMPGWFRLILPNLNTGDSEIPLAAIPYMFPFTSSYVSFWFTLCFLSFFGHSPCFVLCLFLILGLTHIWVYNLKLCTWYWWKNTFAYLEIN